MLSLCALLIAVIGPLGNFLKPNIPCNIVFFSTKKQVQNIPVTAKHAPTLLNVHKVHHYYVITALVYALVILLMDMYGTQTHAVRL